MMNGSSFVIGNPRRDCFICGEKFSKSSHLMGISFFSFPRIKGQDHDKLKEQWNEILGKEWMTRMASAKLSYDAIRVCSLHFKIEDISGNKRKRLKHNAVPVKCLENMVASPPPSSDRRKDKSSSFNRRKARINDRSSTNRTDRRRKKHPAVITNLQTIAVTSANGTREQSEYVSTCIEPPAFDSLVLCPTTEVETIKQTEIKQDNSVTESPPMTNMDLEHPASLSINGELVRLIKAGRLSPRVMVQEEQQRASDQELDFRLNGTTVVTQLISWKRFQHIYEAGKVRLRVVLNGEHATILVLPSPSSNTSKFFADDSSIDIQDLHMYSQLAFPVPWVVQELLNPSSLIASHTAGNSLFVLLFCEGSKWQLFGCFLEYETDEFPDIVRVSAEDVTEPKNYVGEELDDLMETYSKDEVEAETDMAEPEDGPTPSCDPLVFSENNSPMSVVDPDADVLEKQLSEPLSEQRMERLKKFDETSSIEVAKLPTILEGNQIVTIQQSGLQLLSTCSSPSPSIKHETQESICTYSEFLENETMAEQREKIAFLSSQLKEITMERDQIKNKLDKVQKDLMELAPYLASVLDHFQQPNLQPTPPA